MGFIAAVLEGRDPGDGNIISGVDNPFQSGKTVWLPGAGGLNPLNSQSAVGQLTKDIGQLNPFNPDSTAGKVVNNIGKDMSADPAKWVAIAAAVATGQVQLIPYINGVAALTKKNSTPEEWLTEGVKAYAISTGGDWLAKNAGGVGPQTDITTGETFAGTGAAGATGSAQAGVAAGNIARNIFATAARKGSADINSAQIVTGAITSEALNEAFKYLPGFDGLSKGEQTATVNAFKTAFNKDSNAAYQLFNQGFDATIKGLNDAAKKIGYKDLNQQNAVNNFVMDQGSTEDIDALSKYEQKAQDSYDAYSALKQKNDAWFAKNDAYTIALNKYIAVNNNPFISLANKKALYDDVLGQWNWLQDPQNYYPPDQVKAAETAYNAAKSEAEPFIGNIVSLKDQGWDNLAQQKAAAAAGFSTPEAYDTYLADKKVNEDAVKEGWDSVAQKNEAKAAGYTDPNAYDAYLTDKTANETAKAEGWTGADQKNEALVFGYKTPEEYKNYLTNQANKVDLNKVVASADTQTGGAGKDTVTGAAGADQTAGDGTAMGDTTKALAGADAYKYDPATKTYTFTDDDGSTITLDENANPVGFTDATDTSWTGLTDTATGNLKLPKLPSGLMPSVKAPVKKATTTANATTTGTGNTAVTTGSSTVVQTSGNTAVQTGGGLNVPALLAIMSQFGQQPQQQAQQTQEPGQDFEYFDWAADPFATKTKDKTNPTGQPKMAHGGSIDELLEILRRSGI